MAMQPIPLEPGMRVRCVNNYACWLDVGSEYVVIHALGDEVYLQGGHAFPFRADRFKPVVSVKAPSRRDRCCNKTVMMRCKGCPHLPHIFAVAH